MKTYAYLFICLLITANVYAKTEFEFPAKECATGLVTNSYVACIGALAHAIYKVHQWGEDTPIQVCGNSCVGNLKGRISKLKWKWDAKFHCQNKGQGIEGESTAASRDGSMQGAIEDWIRKAAEAGKINVNDFKC